MNIYSNLIVTLIVLPDSIIIILHRVVLPVILNVMNVTVLQQLIVIVVILNTSIFLTLENVELTALQHTSKINRLDLVKSAIQAVTVVIMNSLTNVLLV